MSIKVVRNPARKIDFKDKILVEPPRQTPKTKPVAKFKQNPKDKQDINEKLKELEETTNLIEKIQEEIDTKTKNLEEKEQQLSQKEIELEKMAILWTSLNNIDIKSLKPDELKKITSEQKGFIKDLLEHYIESEEKIKKIQEKPWAGKGASEILKENKELKQKIKELEEQIQWV